MERRVVAPRKNWQARVERAGLSFHTPEGVPYWDESACYRFAAREIDELESATAELQGMCLEAARYVIEGERFESFQIPEYARAALRHAWDAEAPSLYGRFDLMYNGSDPPKLLEYNANTPTALLEASVIQWDWLRDTLPAADQFNSLHEKLIDQWAEIRPCLNGTLYFASLRNPEDQITVAYLRDTAEQAGIATRALLVREIGWNSAAGEFRDLEDKRIRNLFALYPWEWLLKDFGGTIVESCADTVWIEPIWKMVWSNKALLALLWKLFPGHPNLLEAHLDGPHGMEEFVKKPLLSREGENVTVHWREGEAATEGTYGSGGFVWQALAPDAVFDGRRPVIGSWIVTDQGPAGIGIRESAGRVTGNLSTFVPHFFD